MREGIGNEWDGRIAAAIERQRKDPVVAVVSEAAVRYGIELMDSGVQEGEAIAARLARSTLHTIVMAGIDDAAHAANEEFEAVASALDDDADLAAIGAAYKIAEDKILRSRDRPLLAGARARPKAAPSELASIAAWQHRVEKVLVQQGEFSLSKLVDDEAEKLVRDLMDAGWSARDARELVNDPTRSVHVHATFELLPDCAEHEKPNLFSTHRCMRVAVKCGLAPKTSEAPPATEPPPRSWWRLPRWRLPGDRPLRAAEELLREQE